MKNFTKAIVSVLVFALVFIYSSGFETAKAFAPIDQMNINGLTGYWKIKTHEWLGQSFKPTKDRIDAIGVKVAGDGSSASLTAWVVDMTSFELIGTHSITIPSASGWAYFDFPSDLVVTHPGGDHILWLSTDSNTAYWEVNQTNAYSNGNGYIENIPSTDDDFGFLTYAYNYVPEGPPGGGDPVPPSDTPPAVESTNPPTGNSINTPASESTTEIKIPTNLKASDVANDDGTAVKLTWEKSESTDITGYKVYRSQDKNKNFINIDKTKKDILKYTDKKVKADETYYYVVRAYKDKKESANSNVAKVIPINDQKAKSFWQKLFGPYLWFTVGALVLIIAGISILLYFLLRKKKKLSTPAGPATPANPVNTTQSS